PQTMLRNCQVFFHSLADSILLSKNESLTSCGFISDWTDMEGYADFILKYMDDLPEKARGQWLKHSQKKPLFNQHPIEKRQ
nr:hypothetical protein [Spirochaetaceae bacterium]